MDIFIKNIVDILKVEVPLSEEEIEGFIEIPPDLEKGDYAFPCFAIAKQLRNAPAKISAELAQKLPTGDIITDIKAVGPYLNFYVSRKMIFKTVLDEVFTESDSYGCSDTGKGKTAVIDYSSPNIAKHLAVHHLRSAVIGNAIYNIYKTLGYKCIGVNHLGDWGTQFGQLIVGHTIRTINRCL
jgi:arginyl-tRNA synthetase